MEIHPNLILNEVQADGFELQSSFGETTYRKKASTAWSWCTAPLRNTTCTISSRPTAGIPQLYVAGSAWLPRFMAEATQHGASIGLAI